MNFQDLTDTLRIKSGYSDLSATTFKDSRLQEYRDAINATLGEISSTCAPSFFALTRETQINLIAGQQYYEINDWCQRLLTLYTTDIAAHKLQYMRPRNADATGIRNPNIVYPPLGPYGYTDGMRSPTALFSAASGSNTGATVAEGGTTVTFGSGVTLTNTVLNRMLRLNGEGGDYKVTQVTTTPPCSVVIDKPFVSRLRGDGTSNVGTGLTNVRWEIGPPGRVVIQILPMPTANKSLTCRYMALPRTLLNTNDTPEIQQEYHELIWMGGLRHVMASKQNPEAYQMYTTEYANAIALFKKSDIDDVESDDSPRIERLGDRMLPGAPYGTYSRSDSFGPAGVAQW